jgi:LmbE family N-acetylglucosaminyl deacetylase
VSIASNGQHLVVVVAHPDDETFGCGSLIADSSANAAQVTVICATRGEAGERVADPTTDHLSLGEVREQELRAAAVVLGVDRVDLLTYRDSGFDGPLPEGSLCAVAIEALADDLASRLRQLAADVVLTVDGGDGHRDHLHVRHALELALTRPALPKTLVLSCLSNGLMRRWVAEMHALRPDTPYLGLDLDGLGTPDSQLTSIDVSRYVAQREQAIACHRSQTSPFEGLSAELRRAFLSTDFVQYVTP